MLAWTRQKILWCSYVSLGLQIDDPDSFGGMLFSDVTIDLWRLLATQLAVRTLEPGLVTTFVSEVAIAITLQGETVQALRAVVEGLLRLGGRFVGTYEAHEGVHHEKIWKQKPGCETWSGSLRLVAFDTGRIDKFMVYLHIYYQTNDNLSLPETARYMNVTKQTIRDWRESHIGNIGCTT